MEIDLKFEIFVPKNWVHKVRIFILMESVEREKRKVRGVHGCSKCLTHEK